MTNEQIIERIIALNKELDLLKDELLKNETDQADQIENSGWGDIEYDENGYIVSDVFTIDASGLVEKADAYWGLEHSLIRLTEDEYIPQFLENETLFSTKEKAQEIADKQTLWRKLQRFADEHNDEIGDEWCEIMYVNGQLDVVDAIDVPVFGAVKFSSPEIAKQAIDAFRDELTLYFKQCDNK